MIETDVANLLLSDVPYEIGDRVIVTASDDELRAYAKSGMTGVVIVCDYADDSYLVDVDPEFFGFVESLHCDEPNSKFNHSSWFSGSDLNFHFEN